MSCRRAVHSARLCKGEAVVLAVWSPKGGSGTSVVAAGLAVVLSSSQTGRGARIADLTGDQTSIFGVGSEPVNGLAGWLAAGPEAPTDALARLSMPIRPRLVLLPRAGDPGPLPGDGAAGAALAVALDDMPTVLDCGVPCDPAARAAVETATTSVVVMRPCYLALRRAVRDELLTSAMGIVLVGEEHRAIRASDVSSVLGRPVLARVRLRPSIARSVDAGLFAGRLPHDLLAPMRRVLERVGALSGMDEGAAA
jgi:hypothetical protein